MQPPEISRAPPPVFPIRVIDVGETVRSRHGNVLFTKPTSWEFHTISHTWSKEVQLWSANIIAGKMTGQDTLGAEAEASYNDLFRREDFRRDKCFAPFMEFLRLLMADGVKQVWLDALCINQKSESGEKSQELQNMGSYYANSLGCYVCVHGFGEGFELWKLAEKCLVIPRWFNRVWTFQEMLFPKTLTFILDIPPVVRWTINWCISIQEAQGVDGPCNCVMDVQVFPVVNQYSSQVGEFWHRKDKQKPIEIKCGNLLCCKCGGACLIRKTKDIQLLAQESPDGIASDLYFVDRQCIVCLMIMARNQMALLHDRLAFPGSVSFVIWTDFYDNVGRQLERLASLMRLRDEDEMTRVRRQGDARDFLYHGWDPIQVIVEVSKRDCTRDEDRILSILGLLKLEGIVSLRTGKTLDEQLVDLAQHLVRAKHPTVLLKLCATQFTGHSRTGMSWAPSLGVEGGIHLTGKAREASSMLESRQDDGNAPTFTYGEMEYWTQAGLLLLGRLMNHFVGSVQVNSVMDDGSLLLCGARVLWDCSFDRVSQNKFILNVTARNHPSCRFTFDAYFKHSSCLLYYVVLAAGKAGSNVLPLQCLVRLEGSRLQEELHSFKVCLVLLGNLVRNSNEAHHVLMVCVGKKEGGLLHKVGVAWLPGLEEQFSTVEPTPLCTLGGFKDYMDRFVFEARKSQVSPS